MKDIIIPSTKLLTVNIHKLQDTSCRRYFFWRWVMNLVPKKLNLAFWFGSMMHSGCEVIDKTPSLSKAYAAMKKSSKEFLAEYPFDAENKPEISLMTELGKLQMKTYFEKCKAMRRGITVEETEVAFSKTLELSPVIFHGRIDAIGKRKNKRILLERKTARQIDDNYFRRLKFDLQINGYAIGHKELTGYYPSECDYTVLRKTQKYVKKKQTVPQFLKEMEKDYVTRRKWYFINRRHRFGRYSIEAALQDIECMTFNLYSKFSFLSTKQLLDPANWPRDAQKCFQYGVCPYFILCKDIRRYPLYLRLFKERDMRYPEEKKEQNKKYAMSTLVKPKIRSRRRKRK